MQTIRFTVTGRGKFPADMLRRDACFPCHLEDVQAIEDGLRLEDGYFVTRSVTLVHEDPRGLWHPTEGRWSSFGWTVTNVERFPWKIWDRVQLRMPMHTKEE